MKRTIFALIGPLFLLAAGCSNSTTVNARYYIDETHDLVVLPFKDPDFHSRWDGSPLSHDLGRATVDHLARNVDFRVRPYDDVVIDLHQAENRDPRDLSARDVAEICGVDYVLLCDVKEWQLKDPLNLNLHKGTAEIQARLYKIDRRVTTEDDEEAQERLDAQTRAREQAGLPPIDLVAGGRYVDDFTVEARFPIEYMNQYGELFMDPDVVEQGLINAVGRKVAELYFDHEEQFKLNGDEQETEGW
jgi:hypothetical protein